MVLQVCMCYKIISWNTTGPLRQTTVRTSTQDRQKNSKQSKALVRGARIYTRRTARQTRRDVWKNLGISQIRRYAREWGQYSRKKTQPITVSRTPIEEVNKWRAGLYQKIARYTKMGYTIVTQDESHFKDACNVCKILGKTVPTHIHVME